MIFEPKDFNVTMKTKLTNHVLLQPDEFQSPVTHVKQSQQLADHNNPVNQSPVD